MPKRHRRDEGDLLERLSRSGFRIDVAARVRVARILAALPPQADPEQQAYRKTMHDALHACLVSSQIQSQLFSDAFYGWFDAVDRLALPPPDGLHGGGDVASQDTRPRPPIAERLKAAGTRTNLVRGLGGLAIILIAAIADRGATVSSLAGLIADLFRPRGPRVPQGVPNGADLPLASLLVFVAMALGLAALVWTIADVVAQLKHIPAPPPPPPIKDDERVPRPVSPAFQAGLVGGRPRRLGPEEVESIAELLLYVPTEPDEESLDVPASIERTVRAGGLMQIQHPLRGRVSSVVVVEDDWSTGRHWNPIAAELVEGLNARGVPAEHVLFFGTFADLGARGGAGRDGAGTVFADLLERLELLSPAVVFIVTDGAHLRGDDIALLRALREAAPTLWLDHREGSLWDAALEIPQAAGVPVAEASAAGIRALLAGLGGAEAAGARTPRRPVPAYADPARRVLARLGPARAWAEDCALVQPIGPGLAEALRARFHGQVSPLGFGRMASLEGSTVGPAGLAFAPAVEDMLTRGFRQREPAERRRVADFIGAIIQREAAGLPDRDLPDDDLSDRGQLFQAGADWTRLRAELIAEADAATRAAIVALTTRFPPLRTTVQGELRRLTGDAQGAPILPVSELGSASAIRSLTGALPSGRMRERNFYELGRKDAPAALPGRADLTVGAIVPDVGVLVATVVGTDPTLTLLSDEGRTLQTLQLPQTGFRGARPVALAAGSGIALLLLALEEPDARVGIAAYRLVPDAGRLGERSVALDMSLPLDPQAVRPFSIAFDPQAGTAVIGAVGGRTHVVVTLAGPEEIFNAAYRETESDLIDVAAAGDGGFVAALAPDLLQRWRPSGARGDDARDRQPIPARLGTVVRLIANDADVGDTAHTLVYAVPEAGGLVAVQAGGEARSVLPAAGALASSWVARARSLQLTQPGDAVAVFLPDGTFGAVDLASGLDALDAEPEAVGAATAPVPRRLLDVSTAARLMATVRSGPDGVAGGRITQQAQTETQGIVVEMFAVIWKPRDAPASIGAAASNRGSERR